MDREDGLGERRYLVLWSVKAETAKDRLEVRNIVLDGFSQKR